jgi:threonine 3-dehydrogenase
MALKQQLGMKEGFDICFEMSGHASALDLLLQECRHGGKLVLMGVYPDAISVDMNAMIFKGLQVKGIYGREMFRTWYQALQLLQTGLDITPIITHQFPYQDYEAAFSVLAAGQSAKVVLSWD